MKYKFQLFVPLFVFLSCQNDRIELKSDLEKSNIKGNVKKKIERIYQGKDTTIIYESTSIYNKEGFVTKNIVKSTDNTFNSVSSFERDESNRITKEISETDGTVEYVSTYIYDGANVTEITTTNQYTGKEKKDLL